MELNVETVKKRAFIGAAILTGRNIFIQAVSFFSVGLLTFFLEPSEYGVFFLVSAVVNFLAYFGDIGFAAALIQKKEAPTREDLRTVFTLQQLIVFLLLILVFFLTPIIKNFYSLGNDAIYLLWALAFSLFFSSLKTIPTVLLERRLEFNKYVLPQIVETLSFNIVAVYLAYKGFGVASFTSAVLIRGFLGLITTYAVSPWLPGISFSLNSLKSILKFGVPYQANTLLAMVKDDGITIFLGGILGTSGIGLLGWAQKWAFSPLRFFMDQVIKVTFPAFSRIQDEKEHLSNLVSKSIFFVCLLVFPSLIFLNLVSPTLIDIIPRYEKWETALIALGILSISAIFGAITTPLTNTLNAIGKISITFKLMVMWSVLTWIFVPFLSIRFGLNGAAFGLLTVSFSSIIALRIISKYVTINYFLVVGRPAIAALTMGMILLIIRSQFDPSVLQIAVMGFVGVLYYGLVSIILEPDLLNVLKQFRSLK